MSRQRDKWEATKRKAAAPPIPPPREMGFLDAFRVNREPTQQELVNACQTGLPYSCARLNAQEIGKTPLRLFATSGAGQQVMGRSAGMQGWERMPVSKAQRSWLAESATPSLRRRIKAADAVDEILEHPLLMLLEQVNEHMDGFQLFYQTDMSQEALGVAYWWLPPGKGLLPADELWFLPAQHMRPILSKQQIIDHYEFGQGSNKKIIPVDEVIAFRWPSLENPYIGGRSPTRAVYEYITLLSGDAAYAQSRLKNMGRPDAILTGKTADVMFDEGTARRMEHRFKQRFRENGNGGVMVMERALDLKPWNISSKDMEGLPRAVFCKAMIMNAFAVPPSFFDSSKGMGNGAELAAAKGQHAECATMPRLKMLQQVLNQKMVPRYGDKLFLAFDDPRPENTEIKMKVRESDLKTGARTINDVRAEMGEEPVGWGDEPWLPSTLRQPSEERPAPMMMPGSPGGGDEGDKPDKPEEGKPEPEKAVEWTSEAYDMLIAFHALVGAAG